MIWPFKMDTSSTRRPSLVALHYFLHSPLLIFKKIFAHVAKNQTNRKLVKNLLNKIRDFTPTKNTYFGVEKPSEITKTP